MIKQYPELQIYQPTVINGKESKKENFYNLFDTLHDVKLSVIMEKTLVFVKDGLIWEVKYIFMQWTI
jgi:hypothetical protein